MTAAVLYVVNRSAMCRQPAGNNSRVCELEVSRLHLAFVFHMFLEHNRICSRQ